MDLLSAGDRLEIRAAIQDVTDTFMKTDVVYYSGQDSIDIWQEDRGDMVFTAYALKGLVEYVGTLIDEEPYGNDNPENIMITFNMADVDVAGALTPDYKTKFEIEKDYVKFKEQAYRITAVYYDGPLDEKDILLVIKGTKTKTFIKFD